jgi:glutaredoxin 3
MNPQIKIYSSNWCPFCIQAKRLLDSKGVRYEEIIVDGNPSLRARMMEESGRHTVPQIWINDLHVGGCDDLFLLERSEKLDALLS